MKWAILYLLAPLLVCGTCWANEEHNPGFFPSEMEKDITFFDRGSWVSTTHLAYYAPEDRDNRDIRMALLNVGAERYLWRNIGFVADAYLVSTNGNILIEESIVPLESNTGGIGGSLGLKWHFLRGENWSAYVNGTVGLLFTDDDFPARGTRWNFMERADLGFTYRLKEQLHVVVSGSLVHVSNGKGLKDRNPSFTGEGGYVGLIYRFDTLGLFRGDGE